MEAHVAAITAAQDAKHNESAAVSLFGTLQRKVNAVGNEVGSTASTLLALDPTDLTDSLPVINDAMTAASDAVSDVTAANNAIAQIVNLLAYPNATGAHRTA